MGGLKEVVKVAERTVKKLSSPLLKDLKALLGQRSEVYGAKGLDRFAQKSLAEELERAMLRSAYAAGDQEMLLPAGAAKLIGDIAEKTSRLVVSALDGRFHQPSWRDIGGYATMLASRLSGRSEGDILADADESAEN